MSAVNNSTVATGVASQHMYEQSGWYRPCAILHKRFVDTDVLNFNWLNIYIYIYIYIYIFIYIYINIYIYPTANGELQKLSHLRWCRRCSRSGSICSTWWGQVLRVRGEDACRERSVRSDWLSRSRRRSALRKACGTSGWASRAKYRWSDHTARIYPWTRWRTLQQNSGNGLHIIAYFNNTRRRERKHWCRSWALSFIPYFILPGLEP